MRTRWLWMPACVALSSVRLVAQQGAAARDTTHRDSLSTRLAPVTVTTTSAARGDPSSATHISASALQRTPAATPWELLRQAAGVEVHQQGQGPGFASDASVRGFSSDHSTDLALWIDGVPINEPVNGHSEGYNDWSLLFPQAIRDIDVIKGPSSALFGNFALSGVVNVRTLERMKGMEGVVTGGSNGRADVSLMSGFDHGADGGAVVGLRMAREDGFRPNSGNTMWQGHARLVRNLSPTVTVDAGTELYDANWRSAGYLSEEEFSAGQYSIVSNPTDGGFKRRAQERVSLRVLSGDHVIWRTTAYATQGRWQLFLTIPPAGGRFEGTGSQTEEEDSRFGLGLTSALTYNAGSVDLTVGAEARFDHARYENYFTTSRTRDSVDALVTGQQRSGALLAQSVFRIGDRLRVTAGARADMLDTRSIPDTAGAPTVSEAHGVFSPKLGAIYTVGPAVALYANVSRGFRSTDGVLVDPTLVPITVWAYEGGVKLDRNKVHASATLFRMNVSNEQTFNPLTVVSTSGGQSRRQGLELGLAADVNRNVSLSGEWTFNNAVYTQQINTGDGGDGPPVNLAGLRVYNTAKYVGCAAIDLSPGATDRWGVRVAGNWVGPYSPFDEPGAVLGGYGLLHVSARVPIARATVLDVGLRNVLDRAFPELVAGHLVAPGAPRSVFVSVRVRFG